MRLFLSAFWMWQSNRLTTRAERAELASLAGLLEPWAESGVASDEAQRVYAEKRSVFLNPNIRVAVADTARGPGGWHAHGKPALRRAVGLFREVIGLSLSHPVALNPEWLTSTVVSLARGIYEERTCDKMPILADALQDAGCEDRAVLMHCRSKRQVHVRGCWVLDLLLQKS